VGGGLPHQEGDDTRDANHRRSPDEDAAPGDEHDAHAEHHLPVAAHE
jgi:hypothetical protein